MKSSIACPDRPGDAECGIHIHGQGTTVTASYLSDALSDLLRATLALVQGGSHALFSFQEEPGEFRWVLSKREDGTLRLQILWFEDYYSNAPIQEGQLRLDAHCSVKEWTEAVLSATRSLLEEQGEDGYHRLSVRYAFPSELAQQLEVALLSR